MGYHNYKPTNDNLAALHKATDAIEVAIKELFKETDHIKDAKVRINGKHRTAGYNLFSDAWYEDYPALLDECEVKLMLKLKDSIFRKDTLVNYGKAKINPFPACCGICVLNSVELHGEIRGNGIGKAFVKLVEGVAKCLNYSYIMCTTHKVNGPAIGVVECLGYTELDNGFVNSRTKNSVRMFGKNINPDGKSLTDGYLNLKAGV